MHEPRTTDHDRRDRFAMAKFIANFLKDNDHAMTIEYRPIPALISVIIPNEATTVGSKI
jgi:Flp pilus assembly pilin Flp